MTDETNATAATYAAPKTAHPAAFHTALLDRAAPTGAYHRSHAARRCVTSRGPMPITRTSLPGAAVVARSNRCRASRLDDAPRSSAARSTPGRQVDVNTVGSANTASSPNTGLIDMSSTTVTASRSAQPHVVNNDMYMWSSTNTWVRSTERRSRYSGRSWCSTVATDAWSFATCDSRAIVRRSRNLRCTRSLDTRRNQVAAADTPRPIAAVITSPRRPVDSPSAKYLNHSARSASGSAASSDNPNATLNITGSAS